MSNNLDQIKILVCCHKSVELPKNDLFLPIQVGAALTENHWGIQRDDKVYDKDCDNISLKNSNYCELTAVYWAWKNITNMYPNIKYIGLCHYRRFFSLNSKIVKQLRKAIVLPNLWITPYSVENAYKIAHPCSDFDVLRDVVNEKYPEYKESFKQVLELNNKSTLYNMFIMPISIFNDYCSWLFDILFDVEKKINIVSYDKYQKRVFGFMSERLLYVYIKHNKLKCKQNFIEGPETVSIRKYLMNKIRFNIAFYLGKKRK